MLNEKEAFRFAFDVVWKDRAFIPEVVQSFAIVHKCLRYDAILPKGNTRVVTSGCGP